MRAVHTGTVLHWDAVARLGRVRRDDSGVDLVLLRLPAGPRGAPVAVGTKVTFEIAGRHAINVRLVS
jgi:hypothetical protein